MADIKLKSGRMLSDFGKPYFVAEVNSSHNGNVEIARQMIDAAVAAGCDCVKFQSWSAESLYSATYYQTNPISKRIVTKFSLSAEQLKDMAIYCQKKGVDFSSTPYSTKEVDFLIEECNAPFIKVASMDLNNLKYLRYIGGKNVPIVLSTGMSTIDEIRYAIRTIEATGNKNICLLHCISIYPPKIDTIHLNNIVGLRNEFSEYPIGFSDHSKGIEMAVASVALGACLLEKHLTLDSKKIGMDNQMATEPDEMALMITSCLNTYRAMGNKEREVLQDEKEQMVKMRRSVILTRDLAAGHILTLDDLDAKRPGTGIPADEIDKLIGCKLLRNVKADTLLYRDDYKL